MHDAALALHLAHAELRAEIALGHGRAQLFLVLASLGPVAHALSPSGGHGATLAGIASAASALAGVLVVRRSHQRYRAARAALEQMQRELGVDGLRTTGGQRAQRGEPRGERYRVTSVVQALLWVLVVVNAAGAVSMFLPR